MLPQSLVFVDTETTGLSAQRDRVIEIGILRVENGKLAGQYQSLINPNMYISPQIEELTGISKEDLENAPSFEDIQREVFDMLEDAVFVAHNVRFDYAFLKNEFRRCERSFSPKHFCTAKLSRTLFPEHRHHNLDSIIERFGFTVEKRHRAFDDAKVLWDFYQALQKKFPEEALGNVINMAIKKASLPQGLLPEEVASLPQTPGVYIFYGEGSTPLYVGKSKNIKERVMSHFASDHSSSKELRLSQQVKRIETIKTCGELGALIKESQLVKELQPLYNRKLRISRKLIKLSHKEDSHGYESIQMATVDGISPDDIPHIIGIFKSQRQAKNFLITMAKEHTLCEKFLGLEKTHDACFAYRLRNCKGACIGKEAPVSHNFRFVSAFSKYKMKAWPFPGKVKITEKNDSGDIEHFILDNWCLVEHGKSQGDEIISSTLSPSFDLDIYKILLSFLNTTKSRDFSISLLS